MKKDDDDVPLRRYGKRGSHAGMLDALERERFWESVKAPENPWDALKIYRAGESDGDEEDEK